MQPIRSDNRMSHRTFTCEMDFERHIRDVLKSKVETHAPEIRILEYKGIADIIVCREGDRPAIFFIELKYAKDPISASKGIQSEVLSTRPTYIDNHMMWLIGSSDKMHVGQYWLLDSAGLREYITNEIDIKKENNISRYIFRRLPAIDEPELVRRLQNWMRNEHQ